MNAKERLAILKAEELRRAREAAHVPAADDYSDMTRDEVIKMLEQVLEESRGLNKQISDQNKLIGNLYAQLAEKDRKYDELYAKVLEQSEEKTALYNLISKLQKQNDNYADQLAQQRKGLYGRKSQKGTSVTKHEKTRQEEKDDWDGDENNPPQSNGGNTSTSTGKEPVARQMSDRDKLARMARKGKQNREMQAEEKQYHKSVTEGLPEGAEDVKIIIKTVFEEVHKIIEHKFELVQYRLDDKIYQEWRPEAGVVEVIDVVPGTSASSSMMANVISDHTLLHATHYSKQIHLRDRGLQLSRQCVVNWFHEGAFKMKPIVKSLMDTCLRDGAIVNCDETWTRVKVEGKYKKGYIWCLVNKKSKIAIFHYDDGSRGRHVLTDLLKDKKLKALQSDGYNAYMYLNDDLIDIDHIGCMAHARAKFKYAQEQGDPNAIFFLERIGKLYAKEEEYKRLGYSSEQIKTARGDSETIAIIAEMRAKLQELRTDGHPPLSELMEKAANYMWNQWEPIFLYRKDGDYDIDNNLAERTIRPLTGERKASLFFSSHKGAQASAICNTIHATCKAMGISFYGYLKKFFSCIAMGRRDYENLLPQTLPL